MALLGRNIVANLAGSGWTAVMQLAFAPVFLHFLGLEAFGLIGVWLTLQALFAALDLGISTTVNREFARLSVRQDARNDMRDLLRTFEILYWPIGILIGLGVVLLASPIAGQWLQGIHLDAATTYEALLLVALTLALQWPYDLYAGALLGWQRHIPLNAALVAVATFRGPGAALVLWLVSPTIQAFFLWQALCSGLQTSLVAVLAWRATAGPTSPRWRADLLWSIRRFAGGVLGISLLGAILSQMDKVVVSNLLTLDAFGRYTLAALAAGGLSRVVGPLFMALFPKFSEQLAIGDEKGLADVYHRGTQLLSVLVFPAAVVMGLFAATVLRLWTQDMETARLTSATLSLLLVGTALNGVMHLPYALQLAHGWTSLAFWINAVATLVLAPLVYVATGWWGMVGAAGIWALLNAIYVVIGVQLMHRRLLPGEQLRWYREDLLAPLAASLAVALPARLTFGDALAGAGGVAILAAVWVTASVAALLAASRVRPLAASRLRAGSASA
ncbi:polysaccharide biosynthesis protein [soil metagenome]